MTWASGWLAEVTPWIVRFTLVGTLATAFAHVLGWWLLREVAGARVTLWRTTVLALLLVPALAWDAPWRWTLPAGLTPFERSAAEPPRPSVPVLPTEGRGVGLDPAGARERAAAPSAFAPSGTPGGPVRSRAVTPPPLMPELSRDALFGALGFAWVTVAGWFLLQLVAGLLVLHVHARRASDVTREVLHLLPPTMGGGRGPAVRVLRGGPFRVPVCWGVFRPTILLPFGSGSWSAERLRAVILHEGAHVARRDGLFLILTRVACALHWLNPLAWVLLRRLSLDAEAACDSAVVRAGVPARDYARVLVEVAAEARGGRRTEVAVALLRTGTLTWRVTRILDSRGLAPARRRVTLLAASALVLVSVAGATATVTVDSVPLEASEAQREGEGARPPSRQPDRPEAPVDATAPPPTGPVEPPQRPDADAGGSAELVPVAPPQPADAPESGGPAEFIARLVNAGVPARAVPRDADGLTTVSGMRVGAADMDVPDLDPATLSPAGPLPSELAADAFPGAPRVRGTLVESRSGRPVSLARVILTDEMGAAVSGAMSDSNGVFSIAAPSPGEFYLNASALGYRETTMGVELGEGLQLDVEFRIEPAPLPVAGLVVENAAWLNASGFYQRLDAGVGRFFTPGDIEAARGQKVTELLAAVPRIDVVREFGNERVLMWGSGERCVPRVYVNGALTPEDGGGLDAIAPLLVVEAIEVYSSPGQVPLRWTGATYPGSNEACGAIVIWTKG